ncbi:BCCT family transporter [Paenalkalicoccus suaedae]|uniref:BCCT family transporter n=1 Tax=Paenalkalicoccus suaedae TaxID=2592382 RepID=A0A859FBZ9_9BACI|nr:BCCT family transporter [Paenalkalicoccus suaedae]QKS70577.1 BCCT family transporter [Paenalkalicoccus suaedae]
MNTSHKIDWPVTIISGGLLVLFVLASLINAEAVREFVDVTFVLSADYFGAFWQVLMLLTFVIAMVLAFSKYGNIKLGKKDSPEFSTFKWISIIMCTLLAGGGVFWAAAEPVYHFLDTPPMYDAEPGTEAAVIPALAQSYLDWGFLGWAILGTLAGIILMYGHYHRGMPLKPRTLLYPIFGEKIAKNSIIGTAADAFSIIAVAAGTIGPIGFLGLQAAYGLNTLFGIPNTIVTQILIVVGLITIASISALTGLHRGIQFLSRWNIVLTLVLMAVVLLIGPGRFIIDQFINSMGVYMRDLLPISLYRGDTVWLSFWTLFFWGWFIGFGPIMATFIARISRGRTLRELVIAIAVIAPIVTNFWFTIVGGSGIYFELQNPGVISDPLNADGLPASMIAIMTQMPMGTFMALAFLFITVIFVSTTADSMSYTIAVAITGNETPKKALRVFWALLMGAVASILLFIGESSVDALQSFIVATAVPVSILLLPTLWLAPRVAKELYHEQFPTKK